MKPDVVCFGVLEHHCKIEIFIVLRADFSAKYLCKALKIEQLKGIFSGFPMISKFHCNNDFRNTHATKNKKSKKRTVALQP